MKYEGKIYGKIGGKFIEIDNSEEAEAMLFKEKYGKVVERVMLAATYTGLSVSIAHENEFQTTWRICLDTKNKELVDGIVQIMESRLVLVNECNQTQT